MVHIVKSFVAKAKKTTIVAASAAFWDASSLSLCLSHRVEWNHNVLYALPEVVVLSLFAYAACCSHNLPASIAKILDHCGGAMVSRMRRLHLCDVALVSDHAQVSMLASVQAHAIEHEQCNLA